VETWPDHKNETSELSSGSKRPFVW